MSDQTPSLPKSDSDSAWEAFSVAIASVARVRPEAITPETRLGDDLGLDSLALTEVVVLLIVEFDMEELAVDLDDRDWSSVSVGELYDEYRAGRQTGAP